MSLARDAERIMAALGAISGVKRVTRGWPNQPAEDALPLIIVQLTGEKANGWRDDLEYITWREYTVRVFAAQSARADALAEAVTQVMHGFGYGRAFGWEDADGRVHQRGFRFQTCG